MILTFTQQICRPGKISVNRAACRGSKSWKNSFGYTTSTAHITVIPRALNRVFGLTGQIFMFYNYAQSC